MYIFIHAQLVDKFTYSCCFIFLFLIIHIHIYFLYLQIGGAVNFVAVSEILKASPDVIAAAVAADNIVVALYFMLLFALTIPDKVDARKVVPIKTVETTECPVAIPGRGESATVAAPVIDSTTTTTSATTSTSTALTTNLVDTINSNSNNGNDIEEINRSSSVSITDSVTLPELSKALTISLILLGILWPYHYMLFYSVYMLYTIYSSYRRILHLCTLYTITL